MNQLPIAPKISVSISHQSANLFEKGFIPQSLDHPATQFDIANFQNFPTGDESLLSLGLMSLGLMNLGLMDVGQWSGDGLGRSPWSPTVGHYVTHFGVSL
jgi:hypothetical protein